MSAPTKVYEIGELTEAIAEHVIAEDVLFARGADGAVYMVSWDEDANGIYAWPDGVDGFALASFGDDSTAAALLVLAFLASPPAATEAPAREAEAANVQSTINPFRIDSSEGAP